jgi:hypothetical protein
MSNKIYLSKEENPRKVLLVKETPCINCVFSSFNTKDNKYHCERKPVNCMRPVFGEFMYFIFISANK